VGRVLEGGSESESSASNRRRRRSSASGVSSSDAPTASDGGGRGDGFAVSARHRASRTSALGLFFLFGASKRDPAARGFFAAPSRRRPAVFAVGEEELGRFEDDRRDDEADAPRLGFARAEKAGVGTYAGAGARRARPLALSSLASLRASDSSSSRVGRGASGPAETARSS
jgi:hypothetical protein